MTDENTSSCSWIHKDKSKCTLPQRAGLLWREFKSHWSAYIAPFPIFDWIRNNEYMNFWHPFLWCMGNHCRLSLYRFLNVCIAIQVKHFWTLFIPTYIIEIPSSNSQWNQTNRHFPFYVENCNLHIPIWCTCCIIFLITHCVHTCKKKSTSKCKLRKVLAVMLRDVSKFLFYWNSSWNLTCCAFYDFQMELYDTFLCNVLQFSIWRNGYLVTYSVSTVIFWSMPCTNCSCVYMLSFRLIWTCIEKYSFSL